MKRGLLFVSAILMRERHKRNAETMKNAVLLVVVLAVLGGGWLYYRSEQKAQARERAAKQAEAKAAARAEAELAQKRAEDERIRKEQKEADEKEDAVKLFLRFVEKEEDRLTEIVEESKIKMQMIDVDQQSLSDELKSLARRNEGESKVSRQRGEKRRDQVEYVKSILRSPVLNRLAETYMGEDFSAMRSEFENKVGTVVRLREDLTSRRAENQRKYEASVGLVDDEVNKKSQSAVEANKRVRDNIMGHQKELGARVAKLRAEIKKLETKASRSQWDNRKLENLRKDLEAEELRLSHYRDVEGLSSVNTLQNEALLEETKARRTHDEALDKRTRADDEALEEHAHEIGVFGIASQYEGRSLDAVRAAMKQCQALQMQRMADAQKKLKYLKEASANVDLLPAEDIVNLRKQIVKRLTDRAAEGIGVE